MTPRSGKIGTAVWVVTVFGSAAAWGAPLFAQALPNVFRQPPGPAAPTGSGDLTWLLLRVGLLMVIVLLAFAVSFLLGFPAMLKRSKPRWPVEAYGIAWAWFLGLTGVAVLVLFLPEEKLTYWFPSLQKKVPDVVNHWVLKVTVGLCTLLAVILARTTHRSAAKEQYASHS